MERDVREALRAHPDHWLLWSNLGRILGEVGRWNEALDPLRRATAIDPFLPIARAREAIALWGSGDLQAAEAAFDAAAARWPGHPAIWYARVDFLALTGQPGAAIALVEQTGMRPRIQRLGRLRRDRDAGMGAAEPRTGTGDGYGCSRASRRFRFERHGGSVPGCAGQRRRRVRASGPLLRNG